MKTIATVIAALAVIAATVPASAADCTRVLSKQGAKAFFACLDQNRN